MFFLFFVFFTLPGDHQLFITTQPSAFINSHSLFFTSITLSSSTSIHIPYFPTKFVFIFFSSISILIFYLFASFPSRLFSKPYLARLEELVVSGPKVVDAPTKVRAHEVLKSFQRRGEGGHGEESGEVPNKRDGRHQTKQEPRRNEHSNMRQAGPWAALRVRELEYKEDRREWFSF